MMLHLAKIKMRKTKELIDVWQDASEVLKKLHGFEILASLDDSLKSGIEAVSSGSILLDIATGIGGFPRSRITEISGPEGQGKTSLVLQSIASVHRNGGRCAFTDTENSFDPEYAKSLGCKIDKDHFRFPQIDYFEQFFGVTEVIAPIADLIALDSIAATPSKAEFDGEYTDQFFASQARVISQGLRKLINKISNGKAAVVFINQLRDNIGAGYGQDRSLTPGGRALKFYASLRVRVNWITKQLKAKDAGFLYDIDPEEPMGSRVRATCIKNKVGIPFKSAEYSFIWGKGIDRIHELFDYGLEKDIIKRVGNSYEIDSERLGSSKPDALSGLRKHDGLYDLLIQKIKDSWPYSWEFKYGD